MGSDPANRRPAGARMHRAWRSAPGVWLPVLLALTATSARAVVVESEFLGGADIASAAAYCWTKGRPAPNGEMERAIRAEVDKQLASRGYRGYRTTECEAELQVAAYTVKDDFFPGGVLRIEVSMASTGKVAWRGKATGVVVANKPKKRQRVATSAIKKMFKPFPKSRSSL